MARLRWLSLWFGLVLAWFAGASVLPASSVPSTVGLTLAGAATDVSFEVDRDDGEHAAVLEAAAAEAEAADAEAEAAPLSVARARARVPVVAIAVLRTLILPGAIAPRDGPTVVGCCVASRRWAPEGAQGPPSAA